jgi:hypothetical protein
MPTIINKKGISNIVINNKKSPSMQRIVNIYSVGNYKKKKYVLNSNGLNISSSVSGGGVHNGSSSLQRGEELKLKLK